MVFGCGGEGVDAQAGGDGGGPNALSWCIDFSHFLGLDHLSGEQQVGEPIPGQSREVSQWAGVSFGLPNQVPPKTIGHFWVSLHQSPFSV